MKFPDTNLTYLFRRDFTAYKPIIEEVHRGNQPISMLCDVLRDVTGHNWRTAIGEYSLSGAKVTYVGPNKEIYPTNSKYQNVAIIALSDDCAKYSGNLFLHLDKRG